MEFYILIKLYVIIVLSRNLVAQKEVNFNAALKNPSWVRIVKWLSYSKTWDDGLSPTIYIASGDTTDYYYENAGVVPESLSLVRQETYLSVYCICDSMSLNDATEARCTVFNVSDQNDSIWEFFRTQAGILDLKLTIHEDGLHFLPTAVLRNLPSLTTLEVKNASIETLAPHTFADADQLSKLKLNRNKIRHIRPFTFQGLSRVVELELSQNLLTSLERGVFAGLDSLRLLYVDGNNISLVEDSVFQHMRQLEELDLSGNQIAVLAGDTLFGLQKLKKLSLRANQLAILGDNTFAYVPNLVRLDLSLNVIQIIRHQALAGLHRLSFLNLAHNRLTGLDKAALVPVWSNFLNSSMSFSMIDNPLQCSDCRLQWMVKDLKKSTSSANLMTELDKLQCTTLVGSSKNLVQVLSVLICPSSTSQPAFKATIRPRGSSTVTYFVQEEPAVKKQLDNDSSASLQSSSDVQSQVPAASMVTNTVPSERSANSTAAELLSSSFFLILLTASSFLVV